MYALLLPSIRTVLLPTTWGEVTLGQAESLTSAHDLYDVLALLCGVSPEEVMNWPSALLTPELIQALNFSSQPIALLQGLPVPKVILLPRHEDEGDLVPVTTPQDLQQMTFGQAADLGAVLQDTSLSMLQKRLRALAILLYPAYSFGSYDSDHIEHFAEVICSQVKLRDAIPLTDFFLPSSAASAKPTLPTSRRFRWTLASVRQAWRSWRRSGTSWRWWMRWQQATRPAGTSSSPAPGAK